MNIKNFYHSSSIPLHIKFTYPCPWPPITTQRKNKVILQTTKIEREFENDLDSHNSQCPLLLPWRKTTTTTKETTQSSLSPPLSTDAKKGKNKRGKALSSHGSLLQSLPMSLSSSSAWSVESPSLVLDNWWNLGTNHYAKCVDMKWQVPCQVMELDDGHGDGGDQKMIKCFTFWKQERENTKNGLKAKVYVIGLFLFCTQDTIEGVSELGSIAVIQRGEFFG
jgi:hypothetical protein